MARELRLPPIYHSAPRSGKRFFYAWAGGGPRLKGTPGTAEFEASYRAAVTLGLARGDIKLRLRKRHRTAWTDLLGPIQDKVAHEVLARTPPPTRSLEPPGSDLPRKGGGQETPAGSPQIVEPPRRGTTIEIAPPPAAKKAPAPRKKRGAGQEGLTKGVYVEPWSGARLRLAASRAEMSAEDDARLVHLVVDCGLGLTQIAPLMGGKTYAVLTAAMERLGLLHSSDPNKGRPLLAGRPATPNTRHSLSGVPTSSGAASSTPAGVPARRGLPRMGQQQ